MQKKSKIYVAGHNGLVGSAICRMLKEGGYTNLITKSHSELELTDSVAVKNFFQEERPEYVVLAAAKVGGILANDLYRGDFIYQNLMIQTNVIHQSYLCDVKKLLFLGSTCIYPKQSLQPIKEEYLLSGPLEYTNEAYAIAKIAGLKMCESYNLQHGTNFISVMPTNLYGPNDNYDLKTSHVLPALLRKIHLGKALEEDNWDIIKQDLNSNPIEGVAGGFERKDILKVLKKYGITFNSEGRVVVEIWGSGKPMREFLFIDDMAHACIYLMEQVDFNDIVNQNLQLKSTTAFQNTHINIGTGEDISIKNLAYLIKGILGYTGNFSFNHKKPDGTMKKVTDTTKLCSLGWTFRIKLETGIERAYQHYIEQNILEESLKV